MNPIEIFSDQTDKLTHIYISAYVVSGRKLSHRISGVYTAVTNYLNVHYLYAFEFNHHVERDPHEHVLIGIAFKYTMSSIYNRFRFELHVNRAAKERSINRKFS